MCDTEALISETMSASETDPKIEDPEAFDDVSGEAEAEVLMARSKLRVEGTNVARRSIE